MPYHKYVKNQSFQKKQLRAIVASVKAFMNFKNLPHEVLAIISKSFLFKQSLLKRDSNTGVFCEYCEIFRNTYFEEHLTAASGRSSEMKLL